MNTTLANTQILRSTLALLALLAAFVAAAIPAWGDEADLFLPLDAAEAARFASPASPSAEVAAAPEAPTRRWLVRIDRQRLFQAIRTIERDSGAGGSASERLVLNVAEGFHFEFLAERTQRTLSGHSLSGRLDGVAGSAVTFAVHGEMVLGTVWTPLAIYELAHLEDGVHVFRKVDPSRRLPLGEPLKPEGGVGEESEPVEQEDAAVESIVDVLVVWTPRAEANASGEAEMRAAIDFAVLWTNDAQERSGAELRYNLVGAEPIDYVERETDEGKPASGWDLALLEGSEDGFMDGVHARRDALGADLVSLFTGVGNVGGIAYIGGSFSLVNYHENIDSVLTSIVFAHELGHNMGLYHDRYQEFGGAGGRSTSFSFGYVNKRAFAPEASEEDCWLTIMSYYTRCRAAGFDGHVVPYFSTPKRRYPDAEEGVPLGVPKSSDDEGVDGPADAVRRMNQTYRATANRRSGRGDDGDTIATATQIVAASTTFANLTDSDDTDYFRVELPEAGWLRVETIGGDTRGALINAEGETIAEDEDSGRYGGFVIGAELEAGVYFIKVNGLANYGSFDYTLIVSFNPASAIDDHGDGAAIATAVATPSSTAGELQSPSDTDYFRFEIAERGIVRVATTGDTDVVGTLTSADGADNAIRLRDDDSGLGTNFLIAAKLPAGTYFVAVRGFGGDAIGAYSLDVSFVLPADEPDDHADSASGATDLAVGSVIGGELEVPLDLDYFRIAVPGALGPGQLWVESNRRVKAALFHDGGELIGEWEYGGDYGQLVVGSHVAAGSYVLRVEGVEPPIAGPYELDVWFIADQFTIPLFLPHTPHSPHSDPTREGFARIINRSARGGEVTIHAIDDAGQRLGPVTLSLAAKQTAHFNSEDLEMGNTEKGLSAGVGAGEGDWRLELDTDLDIEALAYVRTEDGFLTSMHDAVTRGSLREYEELVAIFNPASNRNQVSKLRLTNQGAAWDSFAVQSLDDRGMGADWFYVDELFAGRSHTFTAQELEAVIGDGAGKWRLVTGPGRYPVRVMNLLESPTGHLTNLTNRPARPSSGDISMPLFLAAAPASNSTRQSFARIISQGGSGDVTIHAINDSGQRFGPVTLSVPGYQAVHFNSNDLATGNAAKGLSGSIDAGDGDWRLEFDTDLDIEALAYVRTDDGFLTSMNTLVPKSAGRLEVVFFNPANNTNQVSRLRLVNPATEPAAITITGMDDAGAAPPEGAITLTLPAGAATSITAQQLEAGADHFTGAFGDGKGKWQLFIEADQDIQAMSLLESAGRITNLSSGTAVR